MSDPMTDERITEIHEREQAASPGPWQAVGHSHIEKGCRCLSCWATTGWVLQHQLDCEEAALAQQRADSEPEPSETCECAVFSFADVDFIERAREDVPALLAEVERLRAELAQVTTATTYLQGPEECLERECEEYFDDDGNERPGVEYCSHLKAKRLTVDEHLAAAAERDAAREQVQRVEALRDRWEATVRDPSIYRHGGVEHAAALAASHLPDLIRALDGTEAGRD